MRLLLILSALALLSVGCGGTTPADDSKPQAASESHDHAAGGDHVHHAEPPADGEAWTCSMHPEVRMHQEGTCPKCKMQLVKEGAEAGADADASMDYYCPMHPEERSHTEGRCSKCNMFLVKKGDEASHSAEPKDAEKKPGDGMHDHGAMGH